MCGVICELKHDPSVEKLERAMVQRAGFLSETMLCGLKLSGSCICDVCQTVTFVIAEVLPSARLLHQWSTCADFSRFPSAEDAEPETARPLCALRHGDCDRECHPWAQPESIIHTTLNKSETEMSSFHRGKKFSQSADV